jgi:hypothetical protein
MSPTELIGERVERAVRPPRADRYVKRLADACETGALAIDLGCGAHSRVPSLARHLQFLGIDSDEQAVTEARASGLYSEVLQADLTDFRVIEKALQGRRPQLVCLLHVIEHFPRRAAFQILESAEALSSRYVLLETPNRFQPQGPEYGNEGQRHLSGWFPHDFEALGYTVRGTGGTRYSRGYAGQPRLRWRGGQSLDFILARLMFVGRAPRHAYALTAWKDVRGVEARLG